LLREENGAAKMALVQSWRESDEFTDEERLVLEYAEAMTKSDQDVSEELIASLRRFLSVPDLVRLTAWICLENFYSKFNRSFSIEAQGFCIVPGTATT
jgi:alkylhydroperoxidase family enzyme